MAWQPKNLKNLRNFFFAKKCAPKSKQKLLQGGGEETQILATPTKPQTPTTTTTFLMKKKKKKKKRPNLSILAVRYPVLGFHVESVPAGVRRRAPALEVVPPAGLAHPRQPLLEDTPPTHPDGTFKLQASQK